MADIPAPTTQTNDPAFNAWVAEAVNAPGAPSAIHGLSITRMLQVYNFMRQHYGAKQMSHAGLGLIPPTAAPTVTIGLRSVGVATNAPTLKTGYDPYTGKPATAAPAPGTNSGGLDDAATAKRKNSQPGKNSATVAALAQGYEKDVVAGNKSAAAEKLNLINQATGAILGKGKYLSWMSTYGAQGGNIDPKTGLSDKQITKWREQYNQDTGSHFTSNDQFLNNENIVMGRGPARTSFETALNIGDGESTKFDYHGTAVSGNTAQLAMATDPLKGGYKAATPYMRTILSAAAIYKVPWQVIYGVIRAASGFNPGAADGFTGTHTNSGHPLNSEGQIVDLARQLAANFKDLGDWSLAALAGKDPNAAMTWRHTGQSSGSGVQDAEYLDAVFGGGSGSRFLDIQQLGFSDWRHAHPEVVINAPGSGSGGGSTTTINAPDPAELREQARETIRSLLFREPTGAEIDAMASRMRSAVIASQQPSTSAATAQGNLFAQIYDGAPSPTSTNRTVQGPDQVNPAADFREQLLNSPEGKSLYAHNPGLSPEDYAGQYANIAQDVLGQANLPGQRLGMQSGSFDTERGYLMGAGQNSYTFRQKLWQVAQQVAQVL